MFQWIKQCIPWAVHEFCSVISRRKIHSKKRPPSAMITKGRHSTDLQWLLEKQRLIRNYFFMWTRIEHFMCFMTTSYSNWAIFVLQTQWEKFCKSFENSGKYLHITHSFHKWSADWTMPLSHYDNEHLALIKNMSYFPTSVECCLILTRSDQPN